MKEEKPLTIGQLAKAALVNVETIRFYERKGILEQPEKFGGFRYYPKSFVSKINFIKRSQELGFTLREVKELLDLEIQEQAKCSDVLQRTEEKITEIVKKISDLKKIKKSLVQITKCCEDRNIPLKDCSILDYF